MPWKDIYEVCTWVELLPDIGTKTYRIEDAKIATSGFHPEYADSKKGIE